MARTQVTTGDVKDASLTDSDVNALNKDGVKTLASMRTLSSSTPAAIGTGAAGSSQSASSSDHVHGTGASTPVTQAFGDVAAIGTGPAAAMTDHKHGMPAGAITDHTHAVTGAGATGGGGALAPTSIVNTGPLTLSGIIFPTLSGDVNDWAPAGFSTCFAVYPYSAASRIITGLAGGVSGRVIWLANNNGGSIVLTLPYNSGSSLTANVFLTPGGVDLHLQPYTAVQLFYNGSDWQVMGVLNFADVAFDATAPSTQALGDSAVVGTAVTAAHRDHKHAMPSTDLALTSSVVSGAETVRLLRFADFIAPVPSVTQNDWAPSLGEQYTQWQVMCSAATALSGITAPVVGNKHDFHILINASAFTLTLKHDVTSTAANRFYCPNNADVLVRQNGTVFIIYDTNASRWRVMGA